VQDKPHRIGTQGSQQCSRQKIPSDLEISCNFENFPGLTGDGRLVNIARVPERKSGWAPPPAEVEVVSVVQKDVPIYGEWVATLDGYVNAQIQPQVTGYIRRPDL